MAHLPIEETLVFPKLASAAEQGWVIVQEWQWSPKATIGTQMVRALDGVCANLVEGDGRYSDNRSVHFFTLSRSSAREAKYRITVASQRRLIAEGLAHDLNERLDHGMRMLDRIIDYRRRTRRQTSVREDIAPYLNDITELDFEVDRNSNNDSHPDFCSASYLNTDDETQTANPPSDPMAKGLTPNALVWHPSQIS